MSSGLPQIELGTPEPGMLSPDKLNLDGQISLQSAKEISSTCCRKDPDFGHMQEKVESDLLEKFAWR